MFELQITDTNVTSGAIPVSWCVDKETLNEIVTTVGNDPQVVIVVAPTKNYFDTKEIRQVVPLRDLMTYLNFRFAGSNKIWAFVTDLSAADARRRYLTKDAGGWSTSILDLDGSGWGWRFSNTAFKDGKKIEWFEPKWGSTLEVNVPSETFAAEPAAWEKVWVNHFFESKAVDQCNFRRRRLFAYTIQPVLMVLQLALRLLITLVALLFGARNFSIKPLLHPLTYSMGDQLFIFHEGSIFIRRVYDDYVPYNSFKDNAWRVLRKIAFLPLMPPILAFILYSIFITPIPALFLLGVIFVVAFALTGIGLICFFREDGKDLLFESYYNWKRRKLVKMNEDEMRLLMCSPERKPVTMRNLPSHKKTIKLRFLDIKSKICKPFSA